MYIICKVGNPTQKTKGSLQMKKIRVTIWNEFIHERQQDKIGTLIRSIYPEGLHKALAKNLSSDDLEIRTASLDEPEQGLPDEILNTTDVLLWWETLRTCKGK